MEKLTRLKKIFPRISTRGFYDLHSGRTINDEPYYLYPKKEFENLIGSKEITIMIHGLRNNPLGALAKFVIAKRRLIQLGYKNPVIGYSYDANTYGAAARGLWWWIAPPGIMIAITGLAFVFIGNALDAIVNPKLKK